MIERGLPQDDRLLDLLAKRASEGLDAREEAELGAWMDDDGFDVAAALIAVGGVAGSGLEPMPAGLRARLEDDADAFVAGGVVSRIGAGGIIEPGTLRRTDRGGGGAMAWLGGLGWLAAAACLALLVTLKRSGTGGPEDLAAQLAALEVRPDVVRTAWVGLDDAGFSDTPHRYDRTLKGEVVWDPRANRGYMVFEGLAKNDPSAYQYQLWIFDADRPTGELPQYGDGILSQRPVDGGVFDATGDGRLIVPIDAKLRVGHAAAFAVTVEPPGGVVVSDRDIVTLAIPGDA